MMGCGKVWLGLMVLLLSGVFGAAWGDEFSPALLEISENEGGWVETTWKVPTKAGRKLAIAPVFPEFMESLGPGSGLEVPGGWVERATYGTGGEALGGATIEIDGLAGVPTDVMVRVRLRDGSEHAAILRSGSDSFTIPLEATKWVVAKSYTKMGMEHILEGYDHLLFVLALMLIVRGFWKLVKTVTAFTIAHSITLALATLGFVNLPSAPTEAFISLSILFLAVEVLRVRAGETPITAKYPWLVAFAFGLFHGLGFAGALSEIGVPQNEVPLALLMFNVGVEAGQLLFVAVIAGLLAIGRFFGERLGIAMPGWAGKVVPYAIGVTAAFWTIERTLGFLGLGGV
ncbi:MAG: HupE/UreJ family protein [Verrucomicrobiota bacterium]